jgi:hypothetical protein
MIDLYVCWYYSSLVFFLWPLNHISFGVSRVRYRCALSVIFRVCDVWMDNMLLWTLFLFQVRWFALFHIVCNNYHCVFWEYTSTIERKETARIGHSGFRFLRWMPSCESPRLSPQNESDKINPIYPIRATSFISIIMYLTSTITVLLKKNGMTFN